MAEGKWIEGLSPTMNLEDAARQTLRQRLDLVARSLPRAVEQTDESIEPVHQLRVATRRADAALRIFRDCLPRRKFRAARDRLRTIRRAAGLARDGDVFLTALRSRLREVKAADHPGLEFLIAFTLGQRALAQQELESSDEDHSDTLAAHFTDTLDAIRPAKGDKFETLRDLARPTISGLLDQLERATSEKLDDHAHLHQVRIAGKRLRYAIEVLIDCFGPVMRDRVYPQIEQMQEILGEANDSHVALVRLQGLRRQLASWPETWKRVKGGIEALLRAHQRRLPQQRKRFLTWLEQWRRLDIAAALRETPLTGSEDE